MEHFGMGVLLGMLGGNNETVKSIKDSIGKDIKSVQINSETEQLIIEFTDGIKLHLWDDGQSCCEHRYMKCDDDLTEFFGAKLLDFELKEATETEDDHETHEIQFLDVKTSKGIFQVSNHNEHNGYYGGFWVQAKTKPHA